MNAANNSFLQMQEEDELNFPVPPDLEQSVIGSLQVLSMMGHALELFIPKALEMFILTLGGTIKEIDKIPSDEIHAGMPINDTDEDAPGIGGLSSDI